MLTLFQCLLCYTDSFILKYFEELKANISLQWTVDSSETDFPQKSAWREEFGGQCWDSVSQQGRSYPERLRRTSTILNKMPLILRGLPVNHGRQADKAMMTPVSVVDVRGCCGPERASQLCQRQGQCQSESESALT